MTRAGDTKSQLRDLLEREDYDTMMSLLIRKIGTPMHVKALACIEPNTKCDSHISGAVSAESVVAGTGQAYAIRKLHCGCEITLAVQGMALCRCWVPNPERYEPCP